MDTLEKMKSVLASMSCLRAVRMLPEATSDVCCIMYELKINLWEASKAETDDRCIPSFFLTTIMLSILQPLLLFSALYLSVEALPQITRTGRYLFDTSGNRFYIKGVAYQPPGASWKTMST